MDLIEESFKRMYPEAELKYRAVLKYSGKLKNYNASIKLNRPSNTLTITMGKSWKEVDDEIKIGLIQTLLIKMLGKLDKEMDREKKAKTTMNIDLYSNFIKSLHISAPKTRIDPKLMESFNRVNGQYFYGLVDMPNLVWGNDNFRTLGTYDYQTDTITLSNIFKDENERVVDYIVYHELLHKKHKFRTTSGRTYSHTQQFRKQEKQFENAEEMEDLIKYIIRRKKKITITRPIMKKQRGFFGWMRFK